MDPSRLKVIAHVKFLPVIRPNLVFSLNLLRLLLKHGDESLGRRQLDKTFLMDLCTAIVCDFTHYITERTRLVVEEWVIKLPRIYLLVDSDQCFFGVDEGYVLSNMKILRWCFFNFGSVSELLNCGSFNRFKRLVAKEVAARVNYDIAKKMNSNIRHLQGRFYECECIHYETLIALIALASKTINCMHLDKCRCTPHQEEESSTAPLQDYRGRKNLYRVIKSDHSEVIYSTSEATLMAIMSEHVSSADTGKWCEGSFYNIDFRYPEGFLHFSENQSLDDDSDFEENENGDSEDFVDIDQHDNEDLQLVEYDSDVEDWEEMDFHSVESVGDMVEDVYDEDEDEDDEVHIDGMLPFWEDIWEQENEELLFLPNCHQENQPQHNTNMELPLLPGHSQDQRYPDAEFHHFLLHPFKETVDERECSHLCDEAMDVVPGNQSWQPVTHAGNISSPSSDTNSSDLSTISEDQIRKYTLVILVVAGVLMYAIKKAEASMCQVDFNRIVHNVSGEALQQIKLRDITVSMKEGKWVHKALLSELLHTFDSATVLLEELQQHDNVFIEALRKHLTAQIKKKYAITRLLGVSRSFTKPFQACFGLGRYSRRVHPT